jgi:hypothetical protein
MKSAIGRIAIFLAARLAHRKRRHCGLGAVEGDAFDDAQAWPAMSTVGKWVTETAFGRIFDFRDAGLADRSVRGDLRMRGATHALGNGKLPRQSPTKSPRLDTIDPPERRRLLLHAIDKGSDRSFAAADTDQNPVSVIEDFAGKPEIARNAPNRRPKSHALNSAAHADLQRDRFCLVGDAALQIHDIEAATA